VDALTFPLTGNERLHFVVELSPDHGLAEGQIGVADVSATLEGQPLGAVAAIGKVRSSPKIYIAVYDGLGREYLGLDRRGGRDQVDIDPLMPNVREFMGDSTWLDRARSQVPTATDPNHVSLLTGSWPGTTGAICVEMYYCGQDEQGKPVTVSPSSDILRWGSEGRSALSLFHVAKNPAMGGDSDAFSAMVLGKEWVGSYFEDTVDVIAGGHSHPDYLPPPEPYGLGDPPSDADADRDRDGWNLRPQTLFRMIPGFPSGLSGDHPELVPSDRWVVEGALRIIGAEDPDVLYVSPTLVDISQHHTGAADRPEEWHPGGDPDVLWDDLNRFNAHGNRDPVLDVLYEADATFGLLVEVLQARRAYDDSILVLTSDHGQRTFMNEYLSATKVCLDAGVPDEAFAKVFSGADIAYLWLSDPSHSDAIESALEGFTVHHPAYGREVHPLVVVNREEMNTGVDNVVGRIAAEAGPHSGELFSEWYIEHPVDDHSKILWPDLIVFFQHRFQAEPSNPLRRMVGGHGGLGWPQKVPLIIHGPSVRRGEVSHQPAYLVDVVPTLCHVLGWTAPANVDGQVLSGILSIP
jgi:hypothetical protein